MLIKTILDQVFPFIFPTKRQTGLATIPRTDQLPYPIVDTGHSMAEKRAIETAIACCGAQMTVLMPGSDSFAWSQQLWASANAGEELRTWVAAEQ